MSKRRLVNGQIIQVLFVSSKVLIKYQTIVQNTIQYEQISSKSR